MKNLVFLLLGACLFFTVSAQNPGDFDLSFANNGYRTDVVPDSVTGTFVQVMQDGRIVAAGISENGGLKQIHLFRYLPDGQLDTTLAQTGELLVPGQQFDSDHFDAIVQPDHKILLYYQKYGASADSLVATRLNADGSLDTGFGNGGWVVEDSDLWMVYPRNILLQQDGKILITGDYYSDSTSDYSLFVRRLLPDGTLDPTFGTNGSALMRVSWSGVTSVRARLQADGKILFAAQTSDTLPPYDDRMVMGRFNSDGSRDTGFGTNGLTWGQPNAFYYSAVDMALSPTGQIYLLGPAPVTGIYDKIMLARFQTDGSLDPGFGTGGYYEFGIPNLSVGAYALKVQPDGKIVMSCEGPEDSNSNTPFALARVLPAGVLDATFGTNGFAYPAMTYRSHSALTLDLQADGRIVVAGSAYDNGSKASMTIARYKAGTTTALEENPAFAAMELFPNPSRGAVQLRWSMAADAQAQVTVLDRSGREVALPLAPTVMAAGNHELNLSLADLPAGVYLVRLQAGSQSATRRMVIVH